MSRTRRLEARQQKEEAERLKHESAREQRRQEREAREEARRNLTIQYVLWFFISFISHHHSCRQEADRLAKIEKAEKAEKEKAEKAEKAAKAKAAAAKAKARVPSGQQENHSGRANGKKKSASSKGAPGGEEWELDCEICHRKGKNLVCTSSTSPYNMFSNDLLRTKIPRWFHVAGAPSGNTFRATNLPTARLDALAEIGSQLSSCARPAP